MQKTTSIEIDLETYKAIIQNSDYINEPPNDVLKRLLKLKDGVIASHYSKSTNNEGITVKNVFLPTGMKLRKHFKGKLYEATVFNGFILLANKKFTSPSGAAVFVAEGPVNGWRFWEYFDTKSNQWKLLEALRQSS